MSITTHQKYCVCIFIVASFLLLWKLDYAPLWNPDEGRYAAASLEMIKPLPGEKSSWLIPHLNTLPRLNKPPLVYWITATSYRIFGVHEWSGRLTSALSSIGILLLLWWMAVAIWGRGVGSKKAFFAMLVWVTAIVPFALSRLLNTDMILTFATTLILVAIWRTAEEKRSWKAFGSAAIGLGLALLSKGPVGIALPLLVVLMWLGITRKKYFYRYFADHKFAILVTFIVGIAIAAPWYLAVNNARPGFLSHFIFAENLGRFSGGEAYHKPSSVFYYLPVLFIGSFPWTFFLAPAAVNYWKERLQFTPQSRARLFLWIWALLIVLFFSVSSTKLITYILPALPAFALLLGDALAEYQLPTKTWKFAMRANIALMALLGIILIGLPHLKFAEKIADVAVFQSWFTIGGIVLLAGALAMLIPGRFPRAQVMTQGLAAILFVFIFPFCVGVVAPYEDISHLIQQLAPQLSSDTQLVQFDTFQPTLIYYTNRPVTVIHQENTSGYNEREYQQSPLFLQKYSAIDTVLNTSKPIVVLVRWQMANIIALRSLHYWGGNNDFALLSNRPAPNGWPLEYIAPGKRNKAIFHPANVK